ncbi:MAG: hypothetical protein HETSPECPRED_008662 [Heterodermia speciosa]|uniref:Uncharacterized protein n=1 Tax=Heterodermia speciosa TaxID=116794 RepID=A0A8H3IU00_9LECA|nr:MAG: hypothetical protein HETSPECPRED_008662 [Heterodermia speciosa]
MSTNGSNGIEDYSDYLPEVHKQHGFLAFVFKFIFDTRLDISTATKVASLVNDKFPDLDNFDPATALGCYKFLEKHGIQDWKQWQDLEKTTRKLRPQ